MDFTGALFEQRASFEGIFWPEAARDWHAAFDQVLFRSTLNMAKSGFQAFAAFDGATLERGIKIDEPDEATAKRTFLAEREKVLIEAERGDPKPAFAARLRWWLEERKKLSAARRGGNAGAGLSMPVAPWNAQRESHLKELERGCRVLKLAMNKSSNRSREQTLYRFELQARRKQSGQPLGEALVSDLYALASDYGASLARPFLALGVVVVLFAAFYAVMGKPPGALPAREQIESALTFSASRVFPVGPYDDVSKEWIRAFEARNGGLATFGLRILATLESLIAIILAFLFGLAVRRRFQIV